VKIRRAMNFILYALIFVLSAAFWYRKKYGHRNKLLAKFPSPDNSVPFFNHSLLFAGKTPAKILETLSQMALKHGPVWRFDMSPFRSFIVLHDPKIIEVVLSSQKLLDKAIEYNDMIEWLGTGLLISTGKKWHQRRKIITPTFHFKILEEFVEIMNKHGEVFVKKLKKFDETPIDIFPMVSLYALDVICGK
jgi:cytochrome P450 family 4